MSTDTKYPTLIYTNTRTRINDKWFLYNKQLRDIVNLFPSDSSFKNFVDHYDQQNFMQNDHELHQQSFLQIVTETVYDYPTVFYSEKTFKPIVNKRPFVMLGATGSIKHLQDMGFKTFNNFWSEDYDSIQDPEKRLLSVFEIVKYVYNKSIEELQTLCNDMENILEYNFNYYIKNFKDNQLKKFEEACIENLNSRYD
jgi:hypothetical protein